MTVPLLAGAAFFSAAALRICDAMLPRLASDFSVTPGTAGQVIIWFAVAYGLVQLLPCYAQLAGVKRRKIGPTRSFRVPHKALERFGSAVQRLAQFVKHPGQGA